MGAVGMVLRERYELVAEIGKGGMSTVYLAKDLTLDSYWAVKQVKNQKSIDVSAFKKEVELLSTLNHPDIPRIVDRIEIGEDFFVVMDFVDGSSLRKKVLAEGPQPEKDVVEWAKMLCDILDYLHHAKQYPIIYRDMKPDNVVLAQSGRTKLIDFGIAKECPPGQPQTDRVGTKGYAAPEQYKGSDNRLDARTDIYSLGATMFYLVTGMVPQKPPQGVPRLRSVNPHLSEGLDYIIRKCTQDDPAKRYQNCSELKNDLNGIDKLTSTYRKQMARKLGAFVTCFVLALVFFATGLVGYQLMMADREDLFQTAFQTATEYDRAGEYKDAARYYTEAIAYKPSDYDAHMLLFQALLPHGEEQNNEQIKAAIDDMRKRYLDNEQSPMYNHAGLLYNVGKYCVMVDEPVYAAYAETYFERIKENKDYKNNLQLGGDVDSYSVFASYISQDSTSRDFGSFNDALLELEKSTERDSLKVDEKLENYFTIIKMYSTYPGQLTNSYQKVYEIASKAKALIDENAASDNITFGGIVPMYQLIAGECYNAGAETGEDSKKEDMYLKSLEWFSYLDELNVRLDEPLALKKANAYKRLFDMHNKPDSAGGMSAETTQNLDMAIGIYEEILAENESFLQAHIYLTQAYLEKELLKPLEAREFSLVRESYQRAERLRNETADVSPFTHSQFGSLRQQMLNAGLEV